MKRSKGHSHGNSIIFIDSVAQQSKLCKANPTLKLIFAITLLIACVWANTFSFSVATIAVVGAGIILVGRTKISHLLWLLKLPMVFIVVSCIALLFEITNAPLGFFHIKLGSLYFSITTTTLIYTANIFLKAIGSIFCLFFISLSTPLPDLIEALKSLKTPKIIIELMYLIYRYIFVLFQTFEKMQAAAESRCGYSSFKNSYFTLTHVAGNLLVSSFKRSSACFDAMEARGYNGNIAFISATKSVKASDIATFTALFVGVFVLNNLLNILFNYI